MPPHHSKLHTSGSSNSLNPFSDPMKPLSPTIRPLLTYIYFPQSQSHRVVESAFKGALLRSGVQNGKVPANSHSRPWWGPQARMKARTGWFPQRNKSVDHYIETGGVLEEISKNLCASPRENNSKGQPLHSPSNDPAPEDLFSKGKSKVLDYKQSLLNSAREAFLFSVSKPPALA